MRRITTTLVALAIATSVLAATPAADARTGRTGIDCTAQHGTQGGKWAGIRCE